MDNKTWFSNFAQLLVAVHVLLLVLETVILKFLYGKVLISKRSENEDIQFLQMNMISLKNGTSITK